MNPNHDEKGRFTTSDAVSVDVGVTLRSGKSYVVQGGIYTGKTHSAAYAKAQPRAMANDVKDDINRFAKSPSGMVRSAIPLATPGTAKLNGSLLVSFKPISLSGRK